MIYLTTPPRREDWERLAHAGVGVMRTPAAGIQFEMVQAFPCWGADNGCYTAGDRFDFGVYLAWLEAMRPAQDTCLFATAPDVVGDASATWERSWPVLPLIRELGYPAALVAQDGWERAGVDWDSFDVLFVGGTDAFKFGGLMPSLVVEAHRQGKPVHMGRVNSWARLNWCAALGFDSADGTTLGFNVGRYLPEVCRWGHRLRAQRTLWDAVPV